MSTVSGIGPGAHPVGCTALRIVVSLYYELEKQGKTVGWSLPLRRRRRPSNCVPCGLGIFNSLLRVIFFKGDGLHSHHPVL